RVLTRVPPIGSHIRNVYVLSDYHNPTESWSYDHSFHGHDHDHVKTHAKHLQAHRYDDGYHDDHKFHGHDHDHEDDEEDMDDDENWGDSKMVGKEKRRHDLVIDSSHLNDRQFWETCLAT
ncbi:hypothetical protein Tco_0874123, partial [Tanacetum coccineum]